MTDLLVVDDNLRDHDRYRAFLAGTGLEARFCQTGAEALTILRDDRAPLRLAVLLWEISGPSGTTDLLAMLRDERPNTAVIVVSGLLDVSRAARANALGANDFLMKPLERDRFCDAVDALLKPRQCSPLLDALRIQVVGAARDFVAMLEELVRITAQPNETVLLLGENGTGKEVLARAVHQLGAKDRRSWVAVNMAGIPAPLMESALFGHEAGAFTDARSQRIGVFEECGEGTLFLDEIGEMDRPLQAKLLRVIQERSFRRVGGKEDLPFQARLVCATNRNLVEEQATDRFRQDLYFRIAGRELRIPPLRARGDDLWLLVDHFLAKYGGTRAIRLARETRALMTHYSFPGNVRELENIIRSAVHDCPGHEILPYHLPINVMSQRQNLETPISAPPRIAWPDSFFELLQKEAVTEIENRFDRDYLPRKLEEAGGNVTRAAKSAGLDPKTFRRKWEQAGLGNLASGE